MIVWYYLFELRLKRREIGTGVGSSLRARRAGTSPYGREALKYAADGQFAGFLVVWHGAIVSDVFLKIEKRLSIIKNNKKPSSNELEFR